MVTVSAYHELTMILREAKLKIIDLQLRNSWVLLLPKNLYSSPLDPLKQFETHSGYSNIKGHTKCKLELTCRKSGDKDKHVRLGICLMVQQTHKQTQKNISGCGRAAKRQRLQVKSDNEG